MRLQDDPVGNNLERILGFRPIYKYFYLYLRCVLIPTFFLASNSLLNVPQSEEEPIK